MGYAHIENLYKNQEILMFKECYALEKIHGSSSHISWRANLLGATPEATAYDLNEGNITFFSGGAMHEAFIKLFDHAKLTSAFIVMQRPEVTIYGEAYGGKEQGMSHTYGKDLKFIVFDVKIGHSWLSVPEAERIAKEFSLEFVSYEKVSTTIEALDAQRDLPSVQAVRNGITEPKKREGVVLRPIIEVKKNNGERICAKHKGADFQETKTPRDVNISPEKLKILTDAQAIAEEWVTITRLQHVLDKLPKDISMEGIPDIMKAMIEDIEREAKGEILESKEARKAISKRTAQLFKTQLENMLH